MEPIDRLVAIEEIKQLKARYFRCMDTKDWDGLRAVWCDDAVQDGSENRPNLDAAAKALAVKRGGDVILESMKQAVGNVDTIHHGHVPEIEITSPTTATGIWAMEDMLRYPEGHRLRSMNGSGHYHDTYEKVDGVWKIASSKLVRLRREEEPAS